MSRKVGADVPHLLASLLDAMPGGTPEKALAAIQLARLNMSLAANGRLSKQDTEAAFDFVSTCLAEAEELLVDSTHSESPKAQSYDDYIAALARAARGK